MVRPSLSLYIIFGYDDNVGTCKFENYIKNGQEFIEIGPTDKLKKAGNLNILNLSKKCKEEKLL